ncbi:MAG: hypothetical protein Q8P07_05690 [bacterium]|nr:hypothetical protein [bacterium]
MDKASVGTFLKWKNTDGKDIFVRISGISFVPNRGIIEKIWVSAGKNNRPPIPPWFTLERLRELGAKSVSKWEVLNELNK